MTSENTDWRHRAACRNHPDKDLWFPIGTSGPALFQAEVAKMHCRRCPVRDACLEFALDAKLESGIYGGINEDERRALKRRNQRTYQAQARTGRKRAAA